MEVINAIGRRKAALARVYVSEGKGNITINKRPLEEYLPYLHSSTLLNNLSNCWELPVNMTSR